MNLNLKVGRAVIFVKYLNSVVSLIFLPKTLIWNKILFSASNSPNFTELVENKPMKSISKANYQYIFFLSNLLLLIVNILRAFNKKTSPNQYCLLLIMNYQFSNFCGKGS